MPPSKNPTVSEEYRDEVAAKGFALYDNKFRAMLEPAHNNEYIAIHVDTEDHAIGRSFTAAVRELRRRHPCDGRMIGMKIGPEPEYGLAARILR